jgi:hypothetical protein
MSMLGADLPGSRLQIVDKWAHMSPFIDPPDFARRLLAAAD